MKHAPSLTIAIVAYNEADNIAALLSDLRSQHIASAQLQAIHVISDGSTDHTVSAAKETNLPLLTVKDSKKRLGLAMRQNQVFQRGSTDLIVLLNADVRIEDPHMINALISPIIHGQAELTSCNQSTLPSKNLIEQSLSLSISLKTRVFEHYQHGDNVYTCHGTARAFSKKLYSVLRFPHSVGEDAYSYLYATYHHYPYVYVPQTTVWYKLPSTFADHSKQALRFHQSKKQFIGEFGELFMRKIYYLPREMIMTELWKAFLNSPISVTLYVAIFCLIKIGSLIKQPNFPTAWDIALSSKLKEGSL